jgi:hypothetical protein
MEGEFAVRAAGSRGVPRFGRLENEFCRYLDRFTASTRPG